MWTSNPVAPALPRDAIDRDARRRALAIAREQWTYASPHDNPIAPVAIAGRFPRAGSYDARWALPYLPQLARALVGVVRGRVAHALRRGRTAPGSSAPLRELFRSAGIPIPPAAAVHDAPLGDGWFARDWLDGPNPLLIARVTDADRVLARFATTEAELVVRGGSTLREEIAAGRLFVADYEPLRGAMLHGDRLGRDTRWRAKYLPAPMVLLHERPGVDPACDLLPLAIRIDQPEAHGHNPTYRPSDGEAWHLARLYVRVADFNLQLLACHIGRHHFLLEPVVLSTHRQLAAEHPVHVLLAPHLAYTLAVNRAALALMKQRGSVFDRMYAGRLPETREIITRSHARCSFAELELEADLVARGVDSLPREFPYRDDARLWTAAIDKFVRAYLRLYYAADDDVRDDVELQAWHRELGSPHAGNLRALGEQALDGREALARLLAQVLFTAGPGHAAAHYPQVDCFTYAPAYPGVASLPPPDADEIVDARRVRATLPSFANGLDQFLTNEMADYRFDRFGDYSGYPLARVTAAIPAITELQAELRAIEHTIEARNRGRARAYRYLLPSLVPNSINI